MHPYHAASSLPLKLSSFNHTAPSPLPCGASSPAPPFQADHPSLFVARNHVPKPRRQKLKQWQTYWVAPGDPEVITQPHRSINLIMPTHHSINLIMHPHQVATSFPLKLPPSTILYSSFSLSPVEPTLLPLLPKLFTLLSPEGGSKWVIQHKPQPMF